MGIVRSLLGFGPTPLAPYLGRNVAQKAKRQRSEGEPKPTREWYFELEDGLHDIEVIHGTFGKRVIRVDGITIAEQIRTDEVSRRIDSTSFQDHET